MASVNVKAIEELSRNRTERAKGKLVSCPVSSSSAVDSLPFHLSNLISHHRHWHMRFHCQSVSLPQTRFAQNMAAECVRVEHPSVGVSFTSMGCHACRDRDRHRHRHSVIRVG